MSLRQRLHTDHMYSDKTYIAEFITAIIINADDYKDDGQPWAALQPCLNV